MFILYKYLSELFGENKVLNEFIIIHIYLNVYQRNVKVIPLSNMSILILNAIIRVAMTIAPGTCGSLIWIWSKSSLFADSQMHLISTEDHSEPLFSPAINVYINSVIQSHLIVWMFFFCEYTVMWILVEDVFRKEPKIHVLKCLCILLTCDTSWLQVAICQFICS